MYSNPDDWSNERLDAARHEADPLADRVVEAIFREGERKAVNRLLITIVRNDQIPPEGLPPVVKIFLEESSTLPDWADVKLIERGEQIFTNHGPLCLAALISASLPETYALRNIATVLDTTQQLEAHAKRRILETAQLLMDVMFEGGLTKEGRGIRATQRVRLLHASIRHLILFNETSEGDSEAERDYGDVLADTRWSVEERGLPVCQEDMAYTVLAFSYSVIRALETLDQDLSQEDRDAYVHTWAVVGFLLGVHQDLLPRDFAGAEKLYNIISGRQAGHTEAAVALTDHVVDAFYQLLRTRALPKFLVTRGLPVLIVRDLLPERTAEITGLARLSFFQKLIGIPLMHLLALVLGGIDWFAHQSSALLLYQRAIAKNMVEHLATLPRSDTRGLFHMPKNLPDHWTRKK